MATKPWGRSCGAPPALQLLAGGSQTRRRVNLGAIFPANLQHGSAMRPASPPPRPRLLRNGPSTLFALLLCALAAPGLSAQAVDLSGEWVFTVQSPNGTGTRQATLVQEGDSITGTISSSRATGDVIGAVEGNTVTLTALLMMATGPFEVVYKAEYTDAAMAGTVDFGDYGFGTFEGRRAGDPGDEEGGWTETRGPDETRPAGGVR